MILSPGRTNALEGAGRDSLPGLKKQLSEEYVDQTEDRIDQPLGTVSTDWRT